MRLLRFLLIGILFGIVMTKSEAVSWFRIQEMFRFQSFHMYGIIGVAVVTGTFCGTCNRIRLTPSGLLKTCLYDQGVFNIKDILRSGATDMQIQQTFLEALGNRAANGWEAEKNLSSHESMSTIGG